MFWTLSEPDWYLTLELITRKSSDPLSQTCSDTRLAATSDFSMCQNQGAESLWKGVLIFLLPPKFPFNASPWLSCDACPNHAPGPAKLAMEMETVWGAWHCQGAESTGWTMRKDEPGAEGDPSTGRTMLSLTSAKSHGAQVGPGWWQWQMSLVAQWSLCRCRGKSPDQAKSTQQVRLSKDRARGG